MQATPQWNFVFFSKADDSSFDELTFLFNCTLRLKSTASSSSSMLELALLNIFLVLLLTLYVINTWLLVLARTSPSSSTAARPRLEMGRPGGLVIYILLAELDCSTAAALTLDALSCCIITLSTDASSIFITTTGADLASSGTTYC